MRPEGNASVTKIEAKPGRFVYIQREREPGETTLVPTAKIPEDLVFPGPYGVDIRHEDQKGHTLLPWHRIVALDYRRESE